MKWDGCTYQVADVLSYLLASNMRFHVRSFLS